jgi:hypothetical protein
MKWIRQHLMLTLAGIVFLAGMGVTIWFQLQSADKGRQIEEDLQQKKQALDALRRKEIFPSVENLGILKRDHSQLVAQYGTLKQAVGNSSIEVPYLARPVEFQQLLAETITKLRTACLMASNNVPQGFAFGFSGYTGRMPADSVRDEKEKRRILNLLGKQLKVVEKLTLLMSECKVEEIRAIRRAPAETIGDPDALDASVSVEEGSLYQSLPFEVQISGTAESIQAFLNKLATSDWFFAIRHVHIQLEIVEAEGGRKEIIKRELATGGFEEEVKEEKEKKRRNRLVSTIRFDLIEFPSASPKATTTAVRTP